MIFIKANHKKQTIAKAMYSEAKPFFKQYQNDVTRKAYQNNFRKFLRYCTANHGITSIQQIKGNVALVQSYTNFLRKEGLSDYTVHTYIAPVCKFCEIPMNKIEKGTRKPSECKRGRTGNGRTERNDNNINNGRVIKENDKGSVVITHGNPPARAMYDSAKEMRNQIVDIAREVFGSD